MGLEEDAERVRVALDGRTDVDERRMFGGVCFFLNGNMLVICTKGERLLVRVGKGNEAKALKRAGAKPVTMKGRPFGGFVFVDGAGYAGRKLRGWLRLAEDFVGQLPPKAPRKNRRSRDFSPLR